MSELAEAVARTALGPEFEGAYPDHVWFVIITERQRTPQMYGPFKHRPAAYEWARAVSRNMQHTKVEIARLADVERLM